MKKYFSFFTVLSSICFLTACRTTYYELKPIPAYKPLDAQKYKKASCYAIYPMPEPMTDQAIQRKYIFKYTLTMSERMLMDAFRRNGYNAKDFSKCLSINDLDQVQHVIRVLQLDASQHKVYDGYAVTYRLIVSVRPPYAIHPIDSSRCFQAFHRIWIPEKEKENKNMMGFFTHPGKELLYIEYSDVLDKSYHHYFEPKYITPLFDNLFMNSEFRKALQPDKRNSGRRKNGY